MHNFQSPSELLFDPGADVFVSAISPNQFEATPAIVDTMFDALEQPCQNKFAAMAIWNTRTMDNNEQQQAQSVYNNVAFASRNLFVDIYTTFFATFRRLYALAVNNACTGLRVSSLVHANFLHQNGIDLFPQARVAPLPIVAIHGLPRWKIVRHHAPSAPTADNV